MDNIENKDDLVKKQYNQFPYPHIPVGSLEDEVLYSSNYEFVNYLCTGVFKSQQGIKILDAGCGTGYSTLKLAQQNPDARILALDLSAASLKVARERLERAGLLSERITFREADLSKLDEPGENFDYIVSTGVLHHLSSPETGLKNLKAHLKDDGLMYLMLYSEYGRYFLNLTRKFIGILQNDKEDFNEGISIGKKLLKVLRPDNPILVNYLKSYENTLKTIGEEFAGSDAQFVDAYINARERTYNIDEMFEFLESNGLYFLHFQDELTWDLSLLLKNDPFLLKKAQKLSQKEKYKLGELINSEKNFAFFAAKQDFKRKNYRDAELLNCRILLSPLNNVEALKDEAGRTSLKIFSPLGLGLQIDYEALFVYKLLENNKSVKDILAELITEAGIIRSEAISALMPFLKNLESSGLLYFLEN